MVPSIFNSVFSASADAMSAVGCSGRSLESGVESGGDGEGKAAYTQDVEGYKIMQRMKPGYNEVQGVEGKGYKRSYN